MSNQNKASAEEKNIIKGGTLYLVATPIGNLSDISERALKVLMGVDFIAAEDTRNSIKLLTHFGIKKTLISYHEYNKRERGEQIAQRLMGGESCALITDAGTPAISDPGEDIVALCAERDILITSIPGACAAITALTLSALPTGKFVFEGFLPAAKKERKIRIDELMYETRTIILYEAPHKLRATLSDLYTALGDRKITLCRELTKMNEEIIRTTISQAVKLYDQREVRGEFVIVINGADAAVLREEKGKNEFWAQMTVMEHINHYTTNGMTSSEAIKAVSVDRSLPKNEVYSIYLKNR